MDCNASKSNGILIGSSGKTDARDDLSFLNNMGIPEYKSKVNMPYKDFPFTRINDLNFNRVSNSCAHESNANVQINEPSTINDNRIVQCMHDPNEQKKLPYLSTDNFLCFDIDSVTNLSGKTPVTPRSTFFSKFERRLTLRRTVSKPASSCYGNSIKNTDKRSSQVPVGRKIRHWLTKYLVPPVKSFAPTLGGSIDKRVSRSTDGLNSVPTGRLCPSSQNLPEFGVCNSYNKIHSLVNCPFEAVKDAIQHGACSYETEILNGKSVVASKRDNPAAHLFPTFSFPSVTAIRPPPCYLYASLAAAGYTACSRKWISSQVLESDKTSATAKRESSSTCLKASSTLQCCKPTSLVLPTHNFVQRQHLNLNLHDADNSEASTTPQASPITGTKHPINSSGVTIRAKSNFSNSAAVEGDQSQDPSHSTYSQHENWNRSSLIMLAVAQASPRNHNAPSSIVAFADTGSAGRQPLSLSDSCGDLPLSPAMAFPSRSSVTREENSSLDVLLPKLPEVPHASVTDAGLQEQVVSLISDLEEAIPPITSVNGQAKELVKMDNGSDQVKDGHYFLRVAESIELELRSRVQEIECYLHENDLCDDVSGHLRTTVGKVNLLLSKKFAQFRGLCMDSIEAMQAVDFAGEFVTLPSDLEGFWAMVMLQVDNVHSMIATCDRIKQNGWQMTPDPSNHNSNFSILSTVTQRQSKTSTVTSRQNKDADDIAKSQARERLKIAKIQYKRSCRKEYSTNKDISTNDEVNSSNGLDGAFLVL